MPPLLSRVRIVIYDLDGVLVDSFQANLAYYNRLLRHFDLPPVGPEHYQLIQTGTSQEVIAALFPPGALADQARAYEQQLDNTEIIPLIALEPAVRPSLQALRRRGYRTAIATNRGKSLPLVLAHHHLTPLFDLTVGSRQVQAPKPDPRYLQIILEAFDLQPQEALYVGDAPVDARLAAAVGVPFLAYKNPHLPAWGHLQSHGQLLDLLPPAP